MMSWGTTTVEIKSGYGLDPKSEIKMLEAVAEIGERHRLTVVATFLGAHSYPPEFSKDHDGYIARLLAHFKCSLHHDDCDTELAY